MNWCYLIHLGQNMWRGPKGDAYPLGKYSETMVTEYDAWRETLNTIAEAGVDTLIVDVAEALQYDSHPELACEGAWTKEFLKKELDYIRSLGMTPIPKLNFSAHHDVWMKEYSSMVATDIYHKVVEDLIKEVAELFDKPEYFHIGMDEEAHNPNLPYFFIHMQQKTGHTLVRGGELFWEELLRIGGYVEKYGMTPWMWGGTIILFPEKFMEVVPKSWIVSAGCYKRLLNPELLPIYSQKALEMIKSLDDHGFTQVPVCMHSRSSNLNDTIALSKDFKHLKGYMMAPWIRTREIDLYAHKSAAKLLKYEREKYGKQ